MQYREGACKQSKRIHDKYPRATRHTSYIRNVRLQSISSYGTVDMNNTFEGTKVLSKVRKYESTKVPSYLSSKVSFLFPEVRVQLYTYCTCTRTASFTSCTCTFFYLKTHCTWLWYPWAVHVRVQLYTYYFTSHARTCRIEYKLIECTYIVDYHSVSTRTVDYLRIFMVIDAWVIRVRVRVQRCTCMYIVVYEGTFEGTCIK